MDFPGGSAIKNPPANAGDVGSIPGSGRSPGEGNGNPLQYSAWKIPGTEEPGGLQSMGLQKSGTWVSQVRSKKRFFPLPVGGALAHVSGFSYLHYLWSWLRISTFHPPPCCPCCLCLCVQRLGTSLPLVTTRDTDDGHFHCVQGLLRHRLHCGRGSQGPE